MHLTGGTGRRGVGGRTYVPRVRLRRAVIGGLIVAAVVLPRGVWGGEPFTVSAYGGGRSFRFAPVGEKGPKATAVVIGLNLEFTPFPSRFLALGLNSETNHGAQLAFSGGDHHGVGFYLAARPPLTLLRHLFVAGGVMWMQIKYIDGRFDTAKPVAGWLPYVAAGIATELKGIDVRLRYDVVSGRMRSRFGKLSYRGMGPVIEVGFHL